MGTWLKFLRIHCPLFTQHLPMLVPTSTLIHRILWRAGCTFITVVVSDSFNLWTSAYQASLSFTISQSLLDSCPLSGWCHATILSSFVPFSSRLQSFLAWGSFPMSWLFAWGGQSIGASASASVLPMNIQDWFPLAWTGWISLLSKGLSRVFSSTVHLKAPVLQCLAK